MSSSKLREIYYQPQHLWKGQKAVKNLRDLSSLKPKVIKQWLSKQAFWQVHLPAPKHVERPHYDITTPNDLHQFDLLYMPGDKLYGNKYKYILSGIDVASRYKVACPLETKQAKEVAEMIYKAGPLTYPKVFLCDNGSEFKSEVAKLLEKNNGEINRATTKYKHEHAAFVEALNKVLAVNLFKVQDAQELNDPEKISSTWVKHLYKLVDRLNDTKTQMTDTKTEDAIKMKEVLLVNQKSYPPEKRLAVDGLYRFLLLPGEEHGDHRKRATDRLWSKKTYRLSEVREKPGNRVMYYLQDGPERAFVKEELVLVPEDTELPPDYVQGW